MRKLILMVVAVGLLVAAPVARGEIRTATVFDPADATPTVSGVPNNPDIRQVLVKYDTNGSISLTVEFYNSLNTMDLSQNYKFAAQFDIGEGSPTYGDSASCYAGGVPGDLYGQHNVLGSFYDRASISGYEGYLYFTRSESVDKKWFTVTATSPALGGRNYRCIEYTLFARSHSSISNIYSEYDPGCDCWFVEPAIDTINGTTTYGSASARGVWFDGFQPAPPPPPPVELAKGKLRFTAVGGCRRAKLTSWKVLPWAGGAPATGTIKARLGRQVREFPASRTAPVRWGRVRPGYRNIHLVYSGDEKRTAAEVDGSVWVSRYGCR